MTSDIEQLDHEVHVYLVDPTAPAVEARRLEYLTWLTPDERARYDRFLVEHARTEFIATRAIVRSVLSRYAPAAPLDWRFEANPWGRPRILGTVADDGLDFNLSNTRGLVACAVGRRVELGVDVEDRQRGGETVALADRYFAPAETRALLALEAAAREERFFTLWTLKEAYIKARGMGLAIGLDRFAFHLDGPSAELTTDPSLLDPGGWQIERFDPTDRHAAALLVRHPERRAVAIKTFWIVP